jgi:hypothetical protein
MQPLLPHHEAAAWPTPCTCEPGPQQAQLQTAHHTLTAAAAAAAALLLLRGLLAGRTQTGLL